MASVTFKTDLKKFVKQLKKKHGALQEASANTVNKIAKKTVKRYQNKVDKEFIVRTKFTYGAIGMYSAHAYRSRGNKLRKIPDINALVFVKNLRGDLHYLAKQEIGAQKKPQQSANNYISMPTPSARGGSINKTVQPRYRLNKSPVRTLRIGGKKKSASNFGVRGDGFNDTQRLSIIYKYRKNNPYNWDLRKPFRFTINGHEDVYVMKGRRLQLVRTLRLRSQKLKAHPIFEQSINMIGESELESTFISEARKLLS